MLPPLLPVETTCLPIPTFQGIVALARNSLTIVDDLAMNHHVVFFIVGMLLWIFPIVFTWPVLPFKVTFEYTLYLLGFEKGRIRGGSFASRHQSSYYGGYISESSPFAILQSSATYGDDSDDGEITVPLYARALGWVAGILAVRSLFI